MHVSKLGGDVVATALLLNGGFKHCIDEQALHRFVEDGNARLEVLGIQLGHSSIALLDSAAALYIALWSIGEPGSVRVKGEEITRHCKLLRRVASRLVA
jgi:hypothetical protein